LRARKPNPETTGQATRDPATSRSNSAVAEQPGVFVAVSGFALSRKSLPGLDPGWPAAFGQDHAPTKERRRAWFDLVGSDHWRLQMVERRPSVVAISLDMPESLLRKVDGWAARQRPPATRPRALQDLLRLGLKVAAVTAKSRRSNKSTKQSAGMAGEVIDTMGDHSATAMDRAHRKTRLLKGPEEFRHMRGSASGRKR